MLLNPHSHLCPLPPYPLRGRVEWEDAGMEREHGAAEACRYVRDLDFPASGTAFDAAFRQDDRQDD